MRDLTPQEENLVNGGIIGFIDFARQIIDAMTDPGDPPYNPWLDEGNPGDPPWPKP